MTSPSKFRELAEKIFIAIVKKIRCPDYGEHRETEAYKEFREESISLIEKNLYQIHNEAREEAIRECSEIADEQVMIFSREGVAMHPKQIGNTILSLLPDK